MKNFFVGSDRVQYTHSLEPKVSFDGGPVVNMDSHAGISQTSYFSVDPNNNKHLLHCVMCAYQGS